MAIARISAFTHRGRVRAANEDTIVVGDIVCPPEMAEPLQARRALAEPFVCAVADGMGGHRGGAVASRIAAEHLARESARLGDAAAVIAELREADAAIYGAMRADANLLGMGTTVVGFALGPQAIWFNIGDSRLYRTGGGALVQLSIDDVPPGRRSGVITQTLGGRFAPGEPVDPHVGTEALRAPARYLLCSDGLTDMLDDGEIAECLAVPDADAVMALFERAMQAGGHDNISIVIVDIDAA